MDEKQEMVTSGRRSSMLTGVTLLVLSLLLVGSVTTLIYLSLHSQPACEKVEEKKPEERITVESKVDIENDDGDKTSENMKYDRLMNVVSYYEGGEFTGADDFAKGIRIMKNKYNKKCYVVPIGTDNDPDKIEKYLTASNGQLVHANTSSYMPIYDILPGEIQDLSIIPERAQSECHNGYQWMVPSRESSSGRVKRAVRCRYCTYFLSNGYLIRYCYTVYYTLYCPATRTG